MEITFLIPTPIALHTALPYIAEFRRRGVKLLFVVDKKVRDATGDLLNDAASVFDVDELARLNRGVFTLYNLLRITFTSKDFSSIYQRWLQQRLSGKNRLSAALLIGLSKLGPKWPSNEINRNLTRWTRPFLPNPFPTSRLVYVTHTAKPYLLCARGLKVYTIMESWDHPRKFPIGHSSEKVFVWNEPLLQDWQESQGDSNIILGYPIKLNYAITAKALKKTELLDPRNNRFMYPTSFGFMSDHGLLVEELRLIEELCRATEHTGHKLLLKPKPNDIPGKLDQFLRFPHVEIGYYQNNEGGSNYGLSENYNERRLRELDQSDLVINLGTTFAIDAAAFGLPVIQLRLACPRQYPLLSSLSTFPHLSRHLLSREECIFTITDSSSVADQLSFLREPAEYLNVAKEFSLRLREWIIPDESLEDAVKRVVTACLK